MQDNHIESLQGKEEVYTIYGIVDEFE